MKEQEEFSIIEFITKLVKVFEPVVAQALFTTGWWKTYQNALGSPATAAMTPDQVVEFCNKVADGLLKASKEHSEQSMKIYAETKQKIDEVFRDLGQPPQDQQN